MPLAVFLLFLLISFGGVFSFVLALQLILDPPYDMEKRITIIGYLLASVWVILGTCMAMGWAESLPFNVYPFVIPAFSFTNACTFLYYRDVLKGERRLYPRDCLHLILPVLSFLALLPSIGRPFDVYGMPKDSPLRGSFAVIATEWFLFAAGVLWILYYAILLARTFVLLRGAAKSSRPVIVGTASIVFVYLAVGALWLLDRSLALGLRRHFLALGSAYLAFVFILGSRIAEFGKGILLVEARRAQYSRSKIEGLDPEALVLRLEGLMSDRHVYHEPDLSLSRLAGYLGISAHQLSELLNSRLKVGFMDFVNSWRLDEAKSLLVSAPDRKVIDISFSVGFNSSSAFYRAFKKRTGSTPVEFRASGAKK